MRKIREERGCNQARRRHANNGISANGAEAELPERLDVIDVDAFHTLHQEIDAETDYAYATIVVQRCIFNTKILTSEFLQNVADQPSFHAGCAKPEVFLWRPWFCRLELPSFVLNVHLGT